MFVERRNESTFKVNSNLVGLFDVVCVSVDPLRERSQHGRAWLKAMILAHKSTKAKRFLPFIFLQKL